MIASPLSRRAVVGGLVGVAALSGCSVSGSSVDHDAADRTRLAQARDSSQRLLDDIDATTVRRPAQAAAFAQVRTVHAHQIAEFSRAAKMADSASGPGSPLSPQALLVQEHALTHQLRLLSLDADRGDVAALLASAAAGIDQALMQVRR